MEKAGSSSSKNLKWLGYPQNILNQLGTDEDLSNFHYTFNRNHFYDDPGQDPGSHPKSTPAEENLDTDSDSDGWETVSEDLDSDFEEQLVLLELNDIPNIQELFAIKPDEFLRFQNRFTRHKSQPVKETYPKIQLKLHNFESNRPIVQIGNRYFSSKWEESVGSALLFKKKDKSTLTTTNTKRTSSKSLNTIVADPVIPWDPVFSKDAPNPDAEEDHGVYEPVAIADKVLKTQLLESCDKKMSRIPRSNRRLFGRLGKIKIPHGYTVQDLLAGKYKLKRRYTRGRNRKQDTDVEEDVELIPQFANIDDQVKLVK